MTKLRNYLLTGLALTGLGMYGNFLVNSSHSTDSYTQSQQAKQEVVEPEAPINSLDSLLLREGYQIQVPQENPDITIIHYAQAHRIDHPMVNSVKKLNKLRSEGLTSTPEFTQLYSSLLIGYGLLDYCQRDIDNELTELSQLPNASKYLFTEELTPNMPGSYADVKVERATNEYLSTVLIMGIYGKNDFSKLTSDELDEFESKFSYFIGADSIRAMDGYPVVKADVNSKKIDGKLVHGEKNIPLPEDRTDINNAFDTYREEIGLQVIIDKVKETSPNSSVVVPLLFGEWHDYTPEVKRINEQSDISLELIKYVPAVLRDQKTNDALMQAADVLLKQR